MKHATKTAKRAVCAMCAAALVATSVGGGMILAAADGETDKKVAVSSITDLATIVQSSWVDSVSWEEDGIHNVIDNTAGTTSRFGGAGLTKQFDVTEGKGVKITFRKPIFSGTEEDGTRNLNEDMDASAAVDIRFENKNNGKVALIRLWCDGASNPNQGATYVEVHDPRGNWTKYDVGSWITGVATDMSSFTVGYDPEDYLCMNIAGGSYGKIDSSTDGYTDFLEEVFADCETLEVMWGREIKGGTKDDTVIMEVNGQSLVPDADGYITDNVAPAVPKIKVAEGEIAINTSYSVRCEKWFDDPSTKAQFAIRPAYDLVAGNGLNLKCKISSDDGVTWRETGVYSEAKGMIENVRFSAAGNYLIAIEATDTVGNTTMGTPVAITAVKGFDITLASECPKTGTVGVEIALPQATSSDKNSEAHPVTVAVEDPVGVAVDVVDGKFTPSIAGVYYVTYSSEYEDNGKTVKTKAEYRINVSAEGGGNEEPEDGKGCNGSIATTSGLCMALATGAIVFAAKRRKK